jgi:hypothetical protein
MKALLFGPALIPALIPGLLAATPLAAQEQPVDPVAAVEAEAERTARVAR